MSVVCGITFGRGIAAVAASLCLMSVWGCGNNGPVRYEVRGDITYEGSPVPGGTITFEPDRAKGNIGQRAYAKITDGTFKTIDSKGVIGGPHLVTIYATDGVPNGPDYQMGTPLRQPSFRTEVDLPQEDTEMNFDVPRK